MNILIKNADFSEVSIGQAGIVERTSLLINTYFKGAGSSDVAGIGYASENKILCYDVSALKGKLVKIVGYVNSYYPQYARFYSGNAITQDTSYTSETVDALNTHFGAPIQTFTDSTSGITTVIVKVPSNANSLCIYAASWHVDDCSLTELAG